MKSSCYSFLIHYLTLNSIIGMPFFVWSEFVGNKGIRLFALTYEYFTEIVEFLGFISCLVAAPLVTEDIDVFCGCLSSVTHSWAIVSKTLHLKIHRSRFMKQLDVMEGILSKNPTFREDGKEVNFKMFFFKQTSYIRILQKAHLILMLFSTSSYLLPACFKSLLSYEEGDVLPVVGYFPFETGTHGPYSWALAFQTCCFFYYNTKTVIIDYFMMSIIVLHSSQLRFLNEVLKDILPENGKDLNESNRKRFAEWVKLHQESYRAASALRPLMSGYIAVEYLYAFVHTCIPAFVITSTKSWGILQKLALLLMITSGLVLFLLLASAGDSLTSVGRSVEKTMYGTHVIKWKESKMAMMMCSGLEQRPLSLRVAYMFPLCCTTYLSVMRLIFTYYMTLNEMQRMKKGDSL